jgi:hypothetical protein
VPVGVATDSAFPFRDEKGYVKVRIDGDRLVVDTCTGRSDALRPGKRPTLLYG